MELIWQGPFLWVLVAVALAGLVHGTLGIGFPMVATPIIALVTDVQTAILLTLAPTLIVNVMSIMQGGQWGESLGRYWPVALCTLGGSVIGTGLLIVSDPAPFKLVLAAVILFYLGTSSVGRMDWVWVRYYPRLAGFGFGALAGLLAGTVNVAVPVLIIYFTEMQLAPLALVQILNLCFLGGKVAQVGTFGFSGHLTQNVLLTSVPLALTAGAAVFAGMGIRRRIQAETYRRWLRKILFLIAGVLIIQFFVGL